MENAMGRFLEVRPVASVGEAETANGRSLGFSFYESGGFSSRVKMQMVYPFFHLLSLR
jgi:hypothetical protein